MKLLVLLLCCAPVCAQTVAEQSPGVYARWSLGPPTDPDWFPIGVWLQDPALAEEYRALGVNTFVGLWKGPTEEQLAQLEAAGMKVVCSANPVGRAHKDDDTIVAWMQVDEPDNTDGRRPGPKATPDEVRRTYERLRAWDPDRPVWLNLGQGVANDRWRGRGAARSDYPAYARATDILSFDVYPVTNVGRDDGEEVLWWVAKGVRRLRAWSEDEAIVWNFVECTAGRRETRKPTPAEVRAEVWLGLVAGSRGIVWFCHEFGERVVPAALLADPELSAAVRRVNHEVLRFAPILNAPTVETAEVLELEADVDAPVAVLVKRQGGALVVFAIGTRNRDSNVRVRLTGAAQARVTRFDTGEQLTVEDGAFHDAFGPYELRVYRLLL